MKTVFKSLIIVMLCIGCVEASHAQAKIAVGIKGGVNLASLNVSDPMASYAGRTGFHAGAFALIKVSKIGIQPELLFSQQGSKITFNSQDLNANYSYINIPILLKLYTVGGINIEAGPQFGYLTNAKSDYNPVTTQPTSTEDVKDAYKKADVSACFGLGWDLPFGLTLDARYNLGLASIDKNAAYGTKNQVWQFSLGYQLFKLGK